MQTNPSDIWKQFGMRYKSHPWHGVEAGEEAPRSVMTFIEMTPADSVKYEVDKQTGYLKVDRPQKFSNIVPALYGFIPQTFCEKEVADYCMQQTGKSGIIGDQDPLDICVLTERNISQGNILVPAVPIGGLRMIDDGEADDKIIAVLKGDEVYEAWQDISDCPERIIERLRHYFLTYKNMPQDKNPKAEITGIYGKEEAHEVIRRSQNDYQTRFGSLLPKLSEAVKKLFSN